MFDNARKHMEEDLARALPEEADWIKSEGETAIANISQMAQEYYTSELQREREERRLAVMSTEDMMKQQQELEREQRHLAATWREDIMKQQEEIECERAMWREEMKQQEEMECERSNLAAMWREDMMKKQEEIEREQRRLAAMWTEDTMKQQQAILDNIERLEGQRAAGRTSQPFLRRKTRQPQQPLAPEQPLPPPPPPAPKANNSDATTRMGHLARVASSWLGKHPTASITSMNSYRAPPFFDNSYFDRPRYPPAHTDEPASRFARSPTESSDNNRKESIQRKPSVIGQPSLPEIWKPTVTPDQDAKLSRAYSFARRNSNASATSTLKGSVSSSRVPLLNALIDEPRSMSTHSDRERTDIRNAEQERHNLDRARGKDNILDDARSMFGAHHKSEKRLGLHQPPSNVSNPSFQANSTLYNHRLNNNSRMHISPPSASRPTHDRKSISSFDKGVFSLSRSLGAKGWDTYTARKSYRA